MGMWKKHWAWAGVAVCGLLLFFAVFSGRIEMAVIPLVLMQPVIILALHMQKRLVK